MTDTNNKPTIQKSAKNPRKITLLARVSLFLLFAAGVMYLALGTLKHINISNNASLLDLIPEIPPAVAKNKLLAQSLAKADKDTRQALLFNQPDQSFGQKAGLLGELYHGNDFYPEALACYEIAMKYDTQNPLWPHHTAMLKQMRGETDSVVKFLKRVIELDDSYMPAVLKLADIYYKMGDPDQATIYYQKRLDINPGDKFALLGLSRIALDNSKWQLAQFYLEKIVESNPTFAVAYRLLSSVHKHLGRTELMIESQEMADKLKLFKNPVAPDPWIEDVEFLSFSHRNLLTLASKYGQMQYVALSRKFFHHALTLDVYDSDLPGLSRLYMNFGMEFLNNDLDDDAMPLIEKAIKIDPRNDEIYRQLGIHLLSEFKAKEAEQKLLKAFKIDPKNASTNYCLGMSAFLQADFQKAIKFYTKAFEIDPELDSDNPSMSVGRELILNPNDPHHYISTANKLLASGHMGISKKFFEKIIELDTGHSVAYHKLGLIFISEQKFQQAEQMFLKALKSDSENGSARLSLARLLFKSNRTQPALQQLRIALQKNPDSVGALNSLAWFMATTEDANSKDPVQAIKLAKHACELTNYQNPKIINTLSLAFASDGQFQQAIETAQKAIELARSSGREVLAKKIQKRVELYKTLHPYREPLPTKTSKN